MVICKHNDLGAQLKQFDQDIRSRHAFVILHNFLVEGQRSMEMATGNDGEGYQYYRFSAHYCPTKISTIAFPFHPFIQPP